MWARSALRHAAGPIAGIAIRLEPIPSRSDDGTVFIPGELEGAHARAADAVSRACQWVVSVRVPRDGEMNSLIVTRIGLDASDHPLVASFGLRSGSWPVTTTETI